MLRYVLVLFLILSAISPVLAVPADEVTETMSRAESLYYEAKFKDAIQLLQHADELLRPAANRMPEKINVKVQLALALIGLNDITQAKASLRDVYAIDADYRMDAEQFPPKVLALADEAKAEQNQIRCQAVRDDARQYFQKWEAVALVNLIQ